MSTLITPRDLPTWVPGRVLSASDGLGWKGVAHRAYLYTGLDVYIPPLDHYMIVHYRRGQTLMDRQVEGQWSRKKCTPGDFSLLTLSEMSHWHWTECINVSHTYLSEALIMLSKPSTLWRPTRKKSVLQPITVHSLAWRRRPAATSAESV